MWRRQRWEVGEVGSTAVGGGSVAATTGSGLRMGGGEWLDPAILAAAEWMGVGMGARWQGLCGSGMEEEGKCDVGNFYSTGGRSPRSKKHPPLMGLRVQLGALQRRKRIYPPLMNYKGLIRNALRQNHQTDQLVSWLDFWARFLLKMRPLG